MRRCVQVTMVMTALVGCGGENSGPNTTDLVLDYATPSGDAQSGDNGVQLADPFQVRVTRDGAPVAGQAVSWGVQEGNGILTQSATTTDANGIATTRLVLGPLPGLNRVLAQIPGEPVIPLVFNAVAVREDVLEMVKVTNNTFTPANVTLRLDGRIVFVWEASARQHNLRPVTGSTRPNSLALSNGPFTHIEQFTLEGTYRYFCSNHGAQDGAGNVSGMSGTVVVTQ